MKRIWMSLLFFSLMGLSLHAQEALKSKDKAAIMKALKEQQKAWNQADIPTFMEGYWQSDSLVFVGSSGPQYGWQTTYDNYFVRYPDKAAMGQLEFSVLRLEKLGSKSAFMIGKWYLTRDIGDVGGYFTLVWKKIDGKWLIVSDHTS
ncbi:MAG: nuclear transport factor 2 family protein [Bacteroidota bacterium]